MPISRVCQSIVLASYFLCFGIAEAVSDLDGAIKSGQYKQITSVLYGVGGELKYEAYWNGATKESLHNTRSATKTLVALAIGMAIEEGHIKSVDDPIANYVPQLAAGDRTQLLEAGITIKDLLTMSSALDCDDNDPNSAGYEDKMHEHRQWTKFVLALPSKADYQRDDEGNGPFAYCTAGSFLLGQIVEWASGKSVDSFLESRLQKPLRINAIDWYKSPTGEIQTGGGAEMTAVSLYKIGELLRGKGVFQGERVLSETWMNEMTTPWQTPRAGQNYGYQLWRSDFECKGNTYSGWFMSGNGGNKLVVIHELDAVIVTTSTLYGTRGMHQQTTDIINKFVLPAIGGCGS